MNELVAITAVRITTTSGRVRVIAEDRRDVRVSGSAEVTQEGSTLTFQGGSGSLEARVPIGVDVMIGTTSGRIAVEGRVGSLSVVSTSGRITAEHAGSLDARSASGRIKVERVDSECRVRSTSGRVTVEACQDCDVSTTSGRVELAAVTGTARAHCISGRIGIRMVDPHDVVAETVSGGISVSVPSGARVWRTTADAPTPPPDKDYDCTVTARSVSGRVDVASR